MIGRLDEARDELAAAQGDVAEAFGAILAAAEAGLVHLRAGLTLDAERALQAILLACAAEDLCGQRLAKVQRLLRGDVIDTLLQGPLLAGNGVDQSMADALFAAHEPTPPT